MRKCQPHLRYATTVFLNTRAIPIGSQYRAAHDKAMTGNEDNDTSVQPQPLWKDHAMGTARQDAGRQKPMALVRCQPPDDLPAKHPFCCNHQHTHRNSNFSTSAPEVEELEYCNEAVFHFLALFVTCNFHSDNNSSYSY